MTNKIEQLNNTTYKIIPKDDPKDRIEVEIGDAKQETFYPQVKIMRWDNETNFSVRLIDNEIGIPQVSSLTDKIIWSKGNIDIEYYEGEEGYKMVWFLKEKPSINKVEFTIQSKGLNFYYQPPLTQQEIDEGCIRPENVVGSYAVYHSTKGGMNDINGMEYKTGKFYHIYRPHLYDTEGKEAWGDLHIENGIYSVEIPQDFLDKAVYPIKSNDTFGEDEVGGTLQDGISDDKIYGYKFSLGVDGNVSSITYYTAYDSKYGGTAHSVQYGIYDNSSPAVLKGSSSGVALASTSYSWKTDSVSASLSSGTYSLCFNHEKNYGQWAYDRTTNNEVFKNSVIYPSWPTPITDFDYASNRQFSIYATYTPDSGSASSSPSSSPSVSPSSSASSSPSSSPSESTSPSVSESVSESVSPSVSESVSESISPSVSESVSESTSPSSSPSESTSPSVSESVSESVSPSVSESVSESVSPSSSPSPGYEGYTKGDVVDLPVDDTDLETAYSDQNYLDVDTKNNVRVGQTATNEYTIHQFKDYVGATGSCSLEWEGQTNCEGSFSTIYLQIYNRQTPAWETVDSNEVIGEDIDFILTANIADLTDYKDTNSVISCRVYQLDV